MNFLEALVLLQNDIEHLIQVKRYELILLQYYHLDLGSLPLAQLGENLRLQNIHGFVKLYILHQKIIF